MENMFGVGCGVGVLEGDIHYQHNMLYFVVFVDHKPTFKGNFLEDAVSP